MTWARIDDSIFFNPKVFVLSPEAKLLYIGGIVYASKFLTDGAIGQGDIPKLARMTGMAVESTLVIELVSSELWHETDTGWQIHDYLEYNPSREHVEEVRQKRITAGRKGGRPPTKSNLVSNLPSKGESPTTTESTVSVDMNSSSRNPFANQNANQFGLDQDYAAACSAWEASGQRLTEIMRGMIGEEVDDWRKIGHPDYVALAIQEAAKHGKMTWKYVQGILNRCEQDKRPPGAGKTNGKHDIDDPARLANWNATVEWGLENSPLAAAAAEIARGYDA